MRAVQQVDDHCWENCQGNFPGPGDYEPSHPRAMDVEHVFDQIVNEEEDIYVVDVFGRFGQVVGFVWLSFEWRVILTEVPGSQSCLRKWLLSRQHIAHQSMWTSQACRRHRLRLYLRCSYEVARAGDRQAHCCRPA